MSGWQPAEDDLTTRAGTALDAAYQERHRIRCSREDFADGWLACLQWLGSRSSFRAERWEPAAPEEVSE